MYIPKGDRELFVGRRVRCVLMKDKTPVPRGTEGTIYHIDDADTIHVKWDNGSTLGLVGEDIWEFVENKCRNPLFRDCHLFYNNKCKGCPSYF